MNEWAEMRRTLAAEEVSALIEACAPIFKAVRINDGDTLSLCAPDGKVIWRASGSWTGSADITLGDLRRIAGILSPPPACPKCWPKPCTCKPVPAK